MKRRIYVVLGLVFISFSSSLIISRSAEAKNCSEAETTRLVQQTKQSNPSSVEALIKCESSAVPSLIPLLEDERPGTRATVTYILSSIGAEAKDATQPLIKRLREDTSTNVREIAATAISNIAPKDADVLKILIETVKQDKDGKTRASAAYALGQSGSGEKAVMLALIEALRDAEDKVRLNATFALARTDKESEEATQPLLKILQDQNESSELRAGAASALGKTGAGNPIAVSALIVSLQKQNNSQIRSQAALALVNVARSFNDKATGIKQVEKAAEVVRNIAKALEEPEFERARLPVDRALESLTAKRKALVVENATRWAKDARNIWLAHTAFWIALIFAYPTSPQIQAIFFWNPWVRNILGLGYVSFLLTWVPFLRRKLFEPFKPSLLADAGLSNFKPNAYFPDSDVSLKGTDNTQPITVVFPSIQGQLILEGDSGLGKTMFLRHLLAQSKRIVVYLPATKCAEGVIEAIQKKLHGDEIKDPKFLQSLVYSGAIDICIDGLNEVNPDTRAKITQFVESHFKGNILMTTQPLEWTPPSTAKTYVIQPLRLEQVDRYLTSRQPFLPKGAIVGDAYEQACHNFLKTLLDDKTPLSSEERKTAQAILSNPMELTLAAWMLARGIQPDLFNLREQQYKLMAEEYQTIQKHDFPLKKFSEAIYQRWLTDEKVLPADNFYNELLCMEDEKYRMVVRRQWQNAKGEVQKEWFFRHDKIAEFFIVQTFLGESKEAKKRLKQHINDSRFRGVYFLLATLLPLDAAQQLREDLIQSAVDTNDHTISDTFIRLLRSR